MNVYLFVCFAAVVYSRAVWVRVCVLYLHTLVIRLLSEGDVSDWESAAAWAPEMINAVTESPRLSRFSRAERVNGARRGWQLSLLDSCPEETEGGAARSDGETSRVWHWCPSVSQSVWPTRSLRQSKITTVENTLRFQAVVCFPPEIWASVLQRYSRVANGVKRCDIASVYFRADIKSYFTSRLLSKRGQMIMSSDIYRKRTPSASILTCFFNSDLWLLQFTCRSSFYNQVYWERKCRRN